MWFFISTVFVFIINRRCVNYSQEGIFLLMDSKTSGGQ
ncbi:hypothetical protein D083_3497 [Dickeya solani RNS 08.23.3.1.A]|nr:hypothetical protein D083_3497 [Dickeya solani RNS 08.23.3.1.A]